MKPIDPSEKYLSENTAKWMALLILCPKDYRDEVKALAEAEGLTPHGVALKLKIPETIVSSLFSEYYDINYNKFINS